MAPKTRFWNAVLVVVSAGNLGAVWFAAQPGEPLHATVHAALALGFGLWAQSRIRFADARLVAGLPNHGSELEGSMLRDEVGDVRRELNEVQERLDFAERLLSQAREGERSSGRREP